MLQKFRCKMSSKGFQCKLCSTFQNLISKICRSQVCKALCSLTCDDAFVFPFQKIPPGDIYTPDSDLFFFFPSLSGLWVAVGRCRTKDKSALFSLTGNSRAEQHLSPLIHYPTLHLASLGLHTSSFLDLSLGRITHLNLQ